MRKSIVKDRMGKEFIVTYNVSDNNNVVIDALYIAVKEYTEKKILNSYKGIITPYFREKINKINILSIEEKKEPKEINYFF